MAYIDRWNASQLLGKRTYWLLDIEYAGKTYRLAHQNLEITSTALGTLNYSSSIVSDITLSTEFSLFSDSAERLSVQIETFMGDDNVIDLINNGYDLAGAPATLSKWIDGEDYDLRRIFVRGRLSDPEYGGANIPISFSLEDNFFDYIEETIPDGNLATNSGNVDIQYIDVEDRGLVYPIVIGNPGKVDDPDSSNSIMRLSGSQGVWASKKALRQELIIAGHETNISSVFLISDEYTSGYPYTVINTTDLSGNKITVIPHGDDVPTVDGSVQGINGVGALGYFQAIYDSSSSSLNVDKKVFICWTAGEISKILTDKGGGLVIDGNLVTGAGDVLKYIIQQSRVSVDAGRITSALQHINNYRIDCTIDAEVKPWDWIRENLLPILPVSLASGVNGLYFILWDAFVSANDSLCSIDSDENKEIEFGDIISIDSSKIANSISIDYCLDIRSDQYQKNLEINKALTPTKSTAKIIGTGNQYILIESKKTGRFAEGITITVTGGGMAPIVMSENILDRTVTLHVPTAAGAKLVDVVNAINETLTSISATLMGGTEAYTLDGNINIGTSGNAFGQSTRTTLTKHINSSPSIFCDLSQRRYSKIVKDGIFKKGIKSSCIYDHDTAGAILAWQSKAFCFPHKTVEAMLPEHTYGWLELGNAVLLTCGRLGLSSKIAFIQAIEYGSDGMVAMRFTMIEDPIRDGNTF